MKLTLKKWLLKNKWIISGVIIGGISGFVYYKQVGCSSGSCAITSNPYMSTLYFSVLGGLLVSIIKSDSKTDKKQE